MPSRKLVFPVLSCLIVVGSVWARPTPAWACGGTFCDSGPTAMPVDQTGENILFVLDGNTVEAHIQIAYDSQSSAEEFAWVIPVPALPDFSVGSDPFFDAVLAGSRPSYGMSTQRETCPVPESASTDGGFTTGATTGTGSTGAVDSEDDFPEVVVRQTVGAFEITVLEGGTVSGLMEWLGENGYDQDENAEPILEEYLEEGHLFVAMKLTNDAAVNEIHPVVLRYEGDEPCVPIRLTRIAAVDDMEIRTFFLGEGRVVPTNYRHVLVNPLKIDWLNLGSNYKQVISAAVDADEADGHAFVTEFAGLSSGVDKSTFYDAAWDADVFRSFADSPADVPAALLEQGLLVCYDEWLEECEMNHLLLRPLLQAYLPVPEGVSEADFYGCIDCFEGQVDLEAWDAEAFADDFADRIVAPAEHARDLLNRWPYLTRMYTTISPDEMSEDPMFHENRDLPDVVAERTAQRMIYCDGDTTVELPDGRVVYIEGSQWPSFQDEMPWEEEVQEGTDRGDNRVLISRTEQINDLLADWNNQTGVTPGEDDDSGCACAVRPATVPGMCLFSLAVLGLSQVRRRRETH